MQAHNQPISSSWTVHAWRTLCTFYLKILGRLYVRLYEIMHLSLGSSQPGTVGGWVEGGSKGAGRQHTRILYIHTHERSMHACVPHSLHNSPHILYEMQMRLYEILRDSAPVRGGSAVGNRRFGSTNHPRNAPLFFDHLYFPNCISIFHAIFPKKSVFVNNFF